MLKIVEDRESNEMEEENQIFTVSAARTADGAHSIRLFLASSKHSDLVN